MLFSITITLWIFIGLNDFLEYYAVPFIEMLTVFNTHHFVSYVIQKLSSFKVTGHFITNMASIELLDRYTDSNKIHIDLNPIRMNSINSYHTVKITQQTSYSCICCQFEFD